MKGIADLLVGWLQGSTESETLEFKEAKSQFDTTKLIRYCVAIANERGGFLVLGVSDTHPRRVVGSSAFATPSATNTLKAKVLDAIDLRVEVHEVKHSGQRVLVIEIPSRATGRLIEYEGAYLMRCGEQLRGMPPEHLKGIFEEDKPDWLSLPAAVDASADEVLSLLDTQKLFDLLNHPYPTKRDGVLDRLESRGLIGRSSSGWTVYNIAAVLLGKDLSAFSHEIERKGARFIVYSGVNKLETRADIVGNKGIAVGFEALVEYVCVSAPQNRLIEEAIRTEVNMFPKQAVRELIANALIHQDFGTSGSQVMIELYEDRLEVSSPGAPTIDPDRFIDVALPRNEQLADLSCRLGLCEDKGSGIDKVVHAAVVFQLPAPEFRGTEHKTVAVLFAHRGFEQMTRRDRIRACYQHCCLQHVSNQKMTNSSLRKRFGLGDSPSDNSKTSQVIAATREVGLIQNDLGSGRGPRHARYVPSWA